MFVNAALGSHEWAGTRNPDTWIVGVGVAVLARGPDVHGSASTVLDQIRTVKTDVRAVVTRSHVSSILW